MTTIYRALADRFDAGHGGPPRDAVGALLRDLALAEAADLVDRGVCGPLGAGVLAFADGRRAARATPPPPDLGDDQHPQAEALVAGVAATLAGLTRRLQAGQLTPAQWRDLAGAALAEGLRSSYAAGAGDTPEGADAARLTDQLAAQGEYLDGFRDDLASAAPPSAAQTAARLGLYANLARQWFYRGAIGRAKATNGGNYRLWWELGASQHCRDCEELADGSPYTPDNAPPMPGSGATACRGNCHCSVIFERVNPGDPDYEEGGA